jgi:hypothetical protein
VFSRQWKSSSEEPHILIVAGRSQLTSSYNTDCVDVLEASYPGLGWNKFMQRACEAIHIPLSNEQVLLEVIFDRSIVRPVALYVGNAAALVRDHGEELVRFMIRWEEFALFSPHHASPMFLALQMPERT